MKSTTNFSPSRDEDRSRSLLQHYESLNEDEEVTEDETAHEDLTQNLS